jgi:FlaA1/EpsC-like NDP-sugar epimerase
MTLGEAVALVIQAFAIASHGDILVLDMGEQLRILDVAHNLIKLSGRPPGSIAITYTGLRPGEKLGEELFYVSEQVLRTRHDRIKKARGPIMGWPELQSKLEELRLKLATARPDVLRKTIREMVPQYRWTDAPAPAKYFQKSAAED